VDDRAGISARFAVGWVERSETHQTILMMNFSWKDYRTVCLLLAVAAMAVLFVRPVAPQKQPVYNLTFIVDITRSMNVADYTEGDRAVSRLEFVKQTLRDLLVKLPCQSKVGLGLFTERRSTLLFEPLEVCGSYAEIDAAISQIDWRMAWAADSNIAQGLKNTLDMLQNRGSTIVFMTDGHEAPPLNPRYRADFSALKDRVKGLIVGVGGSTAMPIPKFDSRGEPAGYYSADDVPHRSSFGESNLDPSQIEGYNARNAPFGSANVVGSEHLSALHETYLEELALEAGLKYARLSSADTLAEAVQRPEFTLTKTVAADVRWQPAVFALLMTAIMYWPFGWWRLKNALRAIR
jgi:mxaL protein